ncbi:MAG: sigma-54-dependent Fis family transcriptional regulator [Sandaracinaceae bacterium]|nr:sigma-54-dependent Fis family transcriptional regulator [Sandaracinaceae bacterium]
MGVLRQEEFEAERRESSTRTRVLKEAVYIGRDTTFAQQLSEQCRGAGIAVRAVSHRSDADALVALARIQVFVVDMADTALAPSELLDEIERSIGGRAGSQGRVVISRVGRGANVVGFSPEEWQLTCQRVIKTLREEPERVALEDLLLGESAAIEAVRAQIRDVAMFSDVSVLVLGETGTGKELVANALHRVGAAPEKPFLAINCAAIPEPLIESELFGHEAGTFTGAKEGRMGILEEAGRGTVFLDEIGEMPSLVQPKLLRALDQRTFRRIGSNREKAFTARIVSATNRTEADLAGLRRDLFYRLAGFVIQLPPLRERLDDVVPLARSFARSFAEAHVLPIPEIGPDAIAALQAHRWPGNVRELKVVVQRSVILARGGTVSGRMIEQGLYAALPARQRRISSAPPAQIRSITPAYGIGDGRNLRELERDVILKTLQSNAGNVARTARQLGIPRSTLRARLRGYEGNE